MRTKLSLNIASWTMTVILTPVPRALLGAMLLSLGISGCAQIQALGNAVSSGVGEGVNNATTNLVGTPPSPPVKRDYPSITTTSLAGLFAGKYPNDLFLYPRAAITVLSAPDFHAEGLPGGNNLKHGCWDMSAVVWTSATKSSTFPFTLCLFDDIPTDMMGEESPDSFQEALGLQHEPAGFKDTGKKRTNGPVPPEGFFPYDVQTVEWLGHDPRTVYRDYDALVFVYLNLIMGVEDGVDYRAWIVKFPAM